jgi:predicted nucleic-acid-binding protein
VIGLDTNVLLRLLTGDHPAQQAAARALLERESSASDPAFVNRVVVIETVWVLESIYAYTRKEIASAIDALLRTVRIATEDADHVRTAVVAYRGGADFADALIAACNAARGCRVTVTFDRKAAKKIAAFRSL